MNAHADDSSPHDIDLVVDPPAPPESTLDQWLHALGVVLIFALLVYSAFDERWLTGAR